MASSSPLWLGGVAASMAACCTHPLDVIKVRMQTLDLIASSKRPSTVSVISNSISQSGFRSLYTGLSAALMRQMSYSMVRLGVYEEMKSRLSKGGPPSGMDLLLAAVMAGGLGGIAGNPADIVLIRMTSDSVRPAEKRYGYRNAVVGVINVIREEKLRGLARGIVPNTMRAMLLNASQLGSYEFLKKTFLWGPIPLINYQLHDNILLHLISSSLAGIISTTVCSPADVLRSRIMASTGNTTITQILRQSFREEGIRFLFKGWTPAFIRMGPNTVLLFIFYEQLKKTWRSTFNLI